MTITVVLGQALAMAAQAVTVAGGLYGLWTFLKRRWHEPPK